MADFINKSTKLQNLTIQTCSVLPKVTFGGRRPPGLPAGPRKRATKWLEFLVYKKICKPENLYGIRGNTLIHDGIYGKYLDSWRKLREIPWFMTEIAGNFMKNFMILWEFGEIWHWFNVLSWWNPDLDWSCMLYTQTS